jgi:hypothetical protein
MQPAHARNETPSAEHFFLFERAYELYRLRPTDENAVALKRVALVGICREGLTLPSLAILETLAERSRHPRIFRMGVRVIWRFLRESYPADRAGWNDYLMVRWQLTKDRRMAAAIHDRTKHVVAEKGSNWDMVRVTAAWMATSQREQNPEFDADLRMVEEACGWCSGVAVQPPPLWSHF